VPWTGLQTKFVARTPGKKADAKPSAKHGIEPVRFYGSLFQTHLSIDTL
jgi:hypothetical protein